MVTGKASKKLVVVSSQLRSSLPKCNIIHNYELFLLWNITTLLLLLSIPFNLSSKLRLVFWSSLNSSEKYCLYIFWTPHDSQYLSCLTHPPTTTTRVLRYFHIWSYRPPAFSLVNVTGLAGILTNESRLFDNCRLGPDRQSRAEQLYINVKVRSWV